MKRAVLMGLSVELLAKSLQAAISAIHSVIGKRINRISDIPTQRQRLLQYDGGSDNLYNCHPPSW